MNVTFFLSIFISVLVLRKTTGAMFHPFSSNLLHFYELSIHYGPVGEMTECSRNRQCVSDVDQVDPPRRLQVDATKALVKELVTMVKQERGRILSAEEKYNILLLQAKFRLRNNGINAENGKGREKVTQNVPREVANF